MNAKFYLTDFNQLAAHSKNLNWLTGAAVSAGEPVEIPNEFEQVDLNELITGGDDCFITRASGDSMEADIYHGDFLIVNRNLQARNGDKVIASVNGLCTVKIFSDSPQGLRLVASNGKYAPRRVSAKDEFEIYGVVTYVVRCVKKN